MKNSASKKPVKAKSRANEGTPSSAVSAPKRAKKSPLLTSKTPVAVTLLSGFLGSGKTTLLKSILTSRSNSLRCAVIVNEISELNIDSYAMGGAGVLLGSDKMVEMTNGCICCTLREDLLNQLRELAESKKYDAVLIESSGIAEPMQVSETFFVDLENGKGPLQEQARLDNCVTVVDASTLRVHLQTDSNMNVIDPRAEGEEVKQHISALLLDQLEFANVILLNKVDKVLPNVPKKERDDEIKALTCILRSINRSAKIISTVHCDVDVKEILNTNNFSLECVNGMVDIKTGVAHVPETLEYGVSSFVYKERRAFHPQRFSEWILRYFVLEGEQEGPKKKKKGGKWDRRRATCGSDRALW